MSHQSISVVVPTHNRLEMLKLTMQALCDQDYPRDKYTVIVVDDGSGDGTFDWLEAFAVEQPDINIRAFRQTQSGPAAARNRGVEMCQDLLVAFTDDDCIPGKGWLSGLAAAMNGEECGAVCGKIVCKDGTGVISRYCKLTGFNRWGGVETEDLVLNTANVICSAEVLREAGGFDTHFTYPGGEDTDMAERIAAMGHRIKHCTSATVLHLGRERFRDLMKAYYNRGHGNAYLKAKRRKGSMLVFAVAGGVKAILNGVRMIVEPPFRMFSRYRAADGRIGAAYCFALFDIMKHTFKYAGQCVGAIRCLAKRSTAHTEKSAELDAQRT